MPTFGKNRMAAQHQLTDVEPQFWPLHDLCRPHTMTSTERLYALFKAVEYIVRNGIPGDFVECGVWRGGSVMMMALTLKHFGLASRKLHCFDTFDGMPSPGAEDIRHADGTPAAAILSNAKRDENNSYWAVSPLERVKGNLRTTGYPQEQIAYIQGKVEDTLPAYAPRAIALLRLDTDWYASTKHELIQLYPLLTPGGVLIIDDYGFWRGSRKAVDEYIAEYGITILLNRIDDTGRIGVKK